MENNQDYPRQVYEWMLLHFLDQQYQETEKALWELEEELRTTNRFFPNSKITDRIYSLSEASTSVLKKGTILYRCRLVKKENETKIFNGVYSKLEDECYEIIQRFIPNLDKESFLKERLAPLWALYLELNPEEQSKWTEAFQSLIKKYSVPAFYGFNEKDSDAPPPGISSAGRINPSGIRYLYAASDVKTAILEVRPILTQHVSAAKIEITEDINLYSFVEPVKPGNNGENWIPAVDYGTISRYFATPNYSGESYYLATQYISEYIKNMKDSNGQPRFDGLCFRSSLNLSGINYVLFDVSDQRKYRICSSELHQVKDLLGNSFRFFPMSATN